MSRDKMDMDFKVLNRKVNDPELMFNSIVLMYLKQNINNRISLKSFISSIEKSIISTTLDVTDGNQKNAADILGLKTTTLNEKIKRYGFVYDQYKTDLIEKIEKKIEFMNC